MPSHMVRWVPYSGSPSDRRPRWERSPTGSCCFAWSKEEKRRKAINHRGGSRSYSFPSFSFREDVTVSAQEEGVPENCFSPLPEKTPPRPAGYCAVRRCVPYSPNTRAPEYRSWRKLRLDGEKNSGGANVIPDQPDC